MTRDLSHALAVAIAAAREAGELLRSDLHRPGGPRGEVDKAPADTEAEQLIRARLLAELPGSSFVGEETGRVEGRAGEPLWLVDPNDGTRDYLRGRRGSAVSIALLVDARPCLGVVFAFSYPDDGGDLFAWAEGCGPVTRNGKPTEPAPGRRARLARRGAGLECRRRRPGRELRLRDARALPRGAEHRPPPGARGGRRGRGRGVAQLPLGLGLRRRARAAARSRRCARRRAGPRGELLARG